MTDKQQRTRQREVAETELSESDQEAMAVLAAYMNPRPARRLYPHARQRRPTDDAAAGDVEQS